MFFCAEGCQVAEILGSPTSDPDFGVKLGLGKVSYVRSVCEFVIVIIIIIIYLNVQHL